MTECAIGFIDARVREAYYDLIVKNINFGTYYDVLSI